MENPNVEVPAMVDRIKEALTYVSDTFVNASHLAAQFKELESNFQALKAELEDTRNKHTQEIEYIRQQNSLLDDSVQRYRSERDAAQTEAQTLRTENAKLVSDCQTQAQEIESNHNEIERLRNELVQVKRDNDEAQYNAIHWQEEHDKLRDKHESALRALGVVPQPRDEEGKFQPYPRAVGDTPF